MKEKRLLLEEKRMLLERDCTLKELGLGRKLDRASSHSGFDVGRHIKMDPPLLLRRMLRSASLTCRRVAITLGWPSAGLCCSVGWKGSGSLFLPDLRAKRSLQDC